jgi:hypothetical protein
MQSRRPRAVSVQRGSAATIDQRPWRGCGSAESSQASWRRPERAAAAASGVPSQGRQTQPQCVRSLSAGLPGAAGRARRYAREDASIVRPRAARARSGGRRLSIERLRGLSAFAIVLAAALILLTTLTPGGAGGGGEAGGCLLGVPCLAGHFVVFALLGVPVALRFATSEAARRSPRRALAMVVLAIWVFAAVDELAQGWVDGREPNALDWVADMLGALTGLIAGSVGLRWLLERR